MSDADYDSAINHAFMGLAENRRSKGCHVLVDMVELYKKELGMSDSQLEAFRGGLGRLSRQSNSDG
eukprot:7226371-Alexandrium_andersonii.AAC.1